MTQFDLVTCRTGFFYTKSKVSVSAIEEILAVILIFILTKSEWFDTENWFQMNWFSFI